MSAQAKKITTYVKDGVTYQKPTRKTKYEKHGYPYPNHLTLVDPALLDKARARAMACSNVMVKYLRDYMVGKVLDGKGRIVDNRVVKGAPWAALVAFRNEEGVLLIGWSKRHAGKAYKIDGKVIPERKFNAGMFAEGRTPAELAKAISYVDIEPLIFTKKDAITIAIIRALTDSIVINIKSKTVRTKNGSFVPKCIERTMPGFINRAEAYFKETVKNIEK